MNLQHPTTQTVSEIDLYVVVSLPRMSLSSSLLSTDQQCQQQTCKNILAEISRKLADIFTFPPELDICWQKGSNFLHDCCDSMTNNDLNDSLFWEARFVATQRFITMYYSRHQALLYKYIYIVVISSMINTCHCQHNTILNIYHCHHHMMHIFHCKH